MTTCTAFKPLTKDDIAACLDISIRTVENWVSDCTLPAPKKLGNRVYWHPDVFYAWLAKRLMEDEAPEVPKPATPPVTRHKAVPSTAKSELEKLRAKDQARAERLLAGSIDS